jgi:alpha-1,3/alpha-1,6-mannosyltransferase
MYLRRPVLAVNNGGPTETIVDGQTGFLRENIPDAFASVMQNVLLEHVDIIRMGEQARNHIIENFSFESFTDKLTVTIENRED